MWPLKANYDFFDISFFPMKNTEDLLLKHGSRWILWHCNHCIGILDFWQSLNVAYFFLLALIPLYFPSARDKTIIKQHFLYRNSGRVTRNNIDHKFSSPLFPKVSLWLFSGGVFCILQFSSMVWLPLFFWVVRCFS